MDGVAIAAAIGTPATRTSGRLLLVNSTTHGQVARRVQLATTRRDRRRGLLGVNQFAPGAAILLVPCMAVHTMFMRFPIDVIFVNRRGYAIHIVERLQPWRMSMSAGAYGVIELASGSTKRCNISVGDRLGLMSTLGDGIEVPVDFDQVGVWARAS
jgi:uncharacterized membrane protein (UPF0127 family)